MELQIGDKAPNFSFPNQDNAEISLQDFRGRWVVLYFYPKDKTPGCTQEDCDFRDNLANLSGLNTLFFGLSPDIVKTPQSFIDKYSLNFPLLRDTHKKPLHS